MCGFVALLEVRKRAASLSESVRPLPLFSLLLFQRVEEVHLLFRLFAAQSAEMKATASVYAKFISIREAETSRKSRRSVPSAERGDKGNGPLDVFDGEERASATKEEERF